LGTWSLGVHERVGVFPSGTSGPPSTLAVHATVGVTWRGHAEHGGHDEGGHEAAIRPACVGRFPRARRSGGNEDRLLGREVEPP